jgi:hypothetical protein
MFKCPKSKLQPKILYMNFLFELFDIHLNEQRTTCRGCNDFKWQNKNISLILLGFVFSPMPFLAHGIVTTL